MSRPPVLRNPVVQVASTFHVGDHTLLVSKVQEGRWTVAVDTRPLDASFMTQANAWEAGVREAARLDLVPPR
jgi:hypothetical protein